MLTNRDAASPTSSSVTPKAATKESIERAQKDASFVSEQGLKEDQAVVRSIQQGLASGANEHFTYGRFETGIAHFHQMLTDGLAKL